MALAVRVVPTVLAEGVIVTPEQLGTAAWAGVAKEKTSSGAIKAAARRVFRRVLALGHTSSTFQLSPKIVHANSGSALGVSS